MKNLMKLLAIVLVLAFATSSTLALTGNGTGTTVLKVTDTRSIGWTWTIPAEMTVTVGNGDTTINDYKHQTWNNLCEIKDALIGYGKQIKIACAVTKQPENANGTKLKATVQFNHSTKDGEGVHWAKPEGMLINGCMVYRGNEERNMNALITFYVQGDVDQVYISDYVGQATFTCTYEDAPAD